MIRKEIVYLYTNEFCRLILKSLDPNDHNEECCCLHHAKIHLALRRSKIS